MKYWLKYDLVENGLYMNASVAFTSFLHVCVEHGLVEDHLDGVQLGQRCYTFFLFGFFWNSNFFFSLSSFPILLSLGCWACNVQHPSPHM